MNIHQPWVIYQHWHNNIYVVIQVRVYVSTIIMHIPCLTISRIYTRDNHGDYRDKINSQSAVLRKSDSLSHILHYKNSITTTYQSNLYTYLTKKLVTSDNNLHNLYFALG